MSYIGNQVTSVPHVIDSFSGDNSTTSFGPMIRAPAGVAAIAVFISGAYKTPGTDYTVDGEYINFTSAPASGTNNIIVHHLGNGTASQTPSDGSVTGTKLAGNIIRANNIVAGQITGNLIGIGAVSGNNIGIGAVSGNNIGISAITSNTLSSNLTVSLTRVLEEANINFIGIGGNVNIDVVNSSVYFFNANTTANVTFNLRANTQNTFNSVTTIGETTTVSIAVKHGTVRHEANLHIDGVKQTLYYAGNIKPSNVSISNSEINLFNYSIFKTAEDTYTVITANTLFGLG